MRSFPVILIYTNVCFSQWSPLPNCEPLLAVPNSLSQLDVKCRTHLPSGPPRNLPTALTVPESFPFSVVFTLLPLLIKCQLPFSFPSPAPAHFWMSIQNSFPALPSSLHFFLLEMSPVLTTSIRLPNVFLQFFTLSEFRSIASIVY